MNGCSCGRDAIAVLSVCCPSIYPAPVSVRSVDMPSIHDFLLFLSFPLLPSRTRCTDNSLFFLRPLFFFLLPMLPFNNIASIEHGVQQTVGGGLMRRCCCSSSLLPFFVHFRLLTPMELIYSIIPNRPILFILSDFPMVIPMVNWKDISNCKQRLRGSV